LRGGERLEPFEAWRGVRADQRERGGGRLHQEQAAGGEGGDERVAQAGEGGDDLPHRWAGNQQGLAGFAHDGRGERGLSREQPNLAVELARAAGPEMSVAAVRAVDDLGAAGQDHDEAGGRVAGLEEHVAGSRGAEPTERPKQCQLRFREHDVRLPSQVLDTGGHGISSPAWVSDRHHRGIPGPTSTFQVPDYAPHRPDLGPAPCSQLGGALPERLAGFSGGWHSPDQFEMPPT
jgi:hypothetical protein